MLRVLLVACACVFTTASMAQSLLQELERADREFSPFVRPFSPRPQIPQPPVTEEDMRKFEKEDLVAQAEECLGKYQCLHRKLHLAYSVAFEKIGCHCYTGRCRPSTYRTVPLSATNDTGIQVWANDTWCDVKHTVLRRNNNKIPAILRPFKAHVCVGLKDCKELECAIITFDN